MHANMWMWAHTFETEQLGMIPFQGVPCYSRGPHCHVLCTIGWPFVLHGTLGCGPTRSRRDTRNGIIPRCSVFVQGPTCMCPVYHWSAICLTRDTGLWAQQLEMKHPGMFPSQGVPCHSRGPHSCGPCTIGRPFVSHGTLGCGPSNLRRNTLECSHPKVFHVIPGAHIPVARVPSVGHRSYTGHWDVCPPV